MRILGVYYGHNSTACLLEDGRVLYNVSEERFTNVKNQRGVPYKAIEYILKDSGLTIADIDKVVIPVKRSAPIYASDQAQGDFFILSLNFLYKFVPFIKSTYGFVSFYHPSLRSFGKFFYKLFANTIGVYTSKKERTLLADYLKISESKIQTIDHHTSHAFSSYYASHFNKKKALVLTLDAEGDGICATVSIFHNNRFKVISKTSADNSLGLMYADVTRYLRMKPLEHEYKVMGLAPYAKSYSIDQVYNRVANIFTIGGKTKLEFISSFDTRRTYTFLEKNFNDVRFDVLAGVFQRLVEDVVVSWVKKSIELTGIKTLCVGGGVFMNVKLNQKIQELDLVDEVFFMPSCGDESTPLGACYYEYIRSFTDKNNVHDIPPIKDLYWGPSYKNEDILNFLNEKNLKSKYNITKHDNIEYEIAKLLSTNNIVARFSGRMEWGARALGNRSIIANPSQDDVVMLINEQMKNRDFWMPFTPSMLEERSSDYIKNPKQVFAPYMIVTFDTKEELRKDIRGAIHPYDFTARPQMVTQDWNNSYYRIIKEFEKLTGIGSVLNTSFNLHGYPIVLSPADALFAFENSGLQYLALENYLLSKK